jgi:hypothetical protein
MPVALIALRFKHNVESATADAMTIRRNRKTPVLLPEWEVTRCVRPEDSPAAYAMKETFGHQLTLRGKFRLTGGSCEEGGVRAVPGGSGPPPRSLPPGPAPATTNANVLGSIPPTPVSFGPGGESDWVTLPLEGTWIWKAGVGTYDVSWDWYYRCAGDPVWHYFARTLHRSYVTLSLPKLPWRQTPDPADDHLPWTEALD